MPTIRGSAVGLAGSVLLVAAAVTMAGAGEELVEDFGSGSALPGGWRPAGGTWRVDDGALVVDSLGGVACITCGDPTWQNYEIEVTATFLKAENDSRWVAVVFRAAADGSLCWSQFPVRLKTTRPNGTEMAVRLKSGRWSVRKRAPAAADSKLSRSRRLRVVVRGEQMEGYLDSRPVIRSAYCVDRSRGCVGLAASGCVARFDDFRVRRLPDTPPAAPATAKPKPCKVIAHRGFSAAAPENTLAAVAAAAEAGADGCEFDVYATRDGHVVLLHDKTVDRTTDGRGKVTELTLAELKRLDAGSWKDPKFAGQRVPTLEEALLALGDAEGTGEPRGLSPRIPRRRDKPGGSPSVPSPALRPSKCRPVIEIKMEGISAKVIEAVRAAGMLDRAAVIAFSQNVVKEVRRLEPRLECAWLSSKDPAGTPDRQAQWIAARAAECGTDLVDLDYRVLSPGLVAELHRRGIRVWTWTVDEPAVMQALMRWGVDGITTNDPALLLRVRREQGGRR